MTDIKLLSFLKEEVVNQALKRRGRKVLANDDVPLEQQILKWSSVRSYVSAIQDLYQLQKARNINSNPPPRDTGTKAFIKALQRRDTALERENYVDKGRDTHLNGYTENQFIKLCDALWSAGNDTSATGGRNDMVKTECYVQTLLDLLLSHFLITRGQDRCLAEISDFFILEFPDEGSIPCFPLIMTIQ